jgi:uncharacterized protein (TIGR02117 family)
MNPASQRPNEMILNGTFTRTKWRRLKSALACLTMITLLQGCSDPGAALSSPPNDAIVYVIKRGWHTEVGLAVEDIAGPLATVARPYPGARFMTFGFGERQFLTSRVTNIGTMIGALLPSQSALLMTVLKATPQQAFGSEAVVPLRISEDGQQRLVNAIWRELELSTSGDPVTLAAGPYPGSEFFAARHTYDGLYTCNTWTAETLRVSGLPIPAAGVLFAGQVMGPVRWIKAKQQAAASEASLSREVSPDDRRTLGE